MKVLALLVGLAACDGATTAQDRMREAYAPTQAVTVGGLAFDLYLAERPQFVYAAGINRLVQIDRATGTVVDRCRARPAARAVTGVRGRRLIVGVPGAD